MISIQNLSMYTSCGDAICKSTLINLQPPMIVAVGLLDPLPRSDNPLQATYTLGRCQTSMMCGEKCARFFWENLLVKNRCQVMS